jgi:hypothetical protein
MVLPPKEATLFHCPPPTTQAAYPYLRKCQDYFGVKSEN